MQIKFIKKIKLSNNGQMYALSFDLNLMWSVTKLFTKYVVAGILPVNWTALLSDICSTYVLALRLRLRVCTALLLSYFGFLNSF